MGLRALLFVVNHITQAAAARGGMLLARLFRGGGPHQPQIAIESRRNRSHLRCGPHGDASDTTLELGMKYSMGGIGAVHCIKPFEKLAFYDIDDAPRPSPYHQLTRILQLFPLCDFTYPITFLPILPSHRQDVNRRPPLQYCPAGAWSQPPVLRSGSLALQPQGSQVRGEERQGTGSRPRVRHWQIIEGLIPMLRQQAQPDLRQRTERQKCDGIRCPPAWGDSVSICIQPADQRGAARCQEIHHQHPGNSGKHS